MSPTSARGWVLSLLIISSVGALAEEGKHEEPAKHEATVEHATTAVREDTPGLVEHNARTSSRDVKVPQALVSRIEKEYKAFLLKQEGTHEKDEIKRSLINITAELTQARTAALHENTRIKMPTGGGVVDLSEIVTPLRGAFKLRLFTSNPRGEPISTSRVFFVSHAKARILGGEEYGDGCNKYMDISSRYHKKWENNGFELYTADQRYVSVLGGTFIFVEYSKEALSVGSVSFTDSRYPELLCE